MMGYQASGNPYYYKRHWTEDPADVPRSPKSCEDLATKSGATMQHADVLVSILLTLQKLDIKLGAQSKRLDVLEIRSSTASSPGETLSGNSPISRHQSMRTAVSKYDFNEYDDSITEPRRKMDDTLSLAESAGRSFDWRSIDMPENARIDRPHKYHSPVDVDVYSESDYTEDLLSSRMSLNCLSTMAPSQLQGKPVSPQGRPENDVDMPIYGIQKGAERAAVMMKLASQPDNGGQQESKLVWIDVRETRTHPAYRRAEIRIQAFDNWKQGVLSNLRGDSRRAWKSEKKRLGALSGTESRQTFVERLLADARKAMRGQ